MLGIDDGKRVGCVVGCFEGLEDGMVVGNEEG